MSPLPRSLLPAFFIGELGRTIGYHLRMSPDETLKVLRAEMNAATERARLASERFDAILQDLPSGIPHPDGTQRIRNASREYADARKDLMETLRKINDYVIL